MNTQQRQEIRQPVSEDWHSRKEPTAKERNLTVNPGDIVNDESKSVDEKAKQVAVDYPNGERKALHHVRDAKEISDVVRLARMDEQGNRIWW